MQRLLAKKCELCGAEGSCQVHHVRKLADLNQPGRSEKPLWVKRMAARRRKTLVVCQSCHEAIHRERPNRHSFRTETTGEPREIERLTPGSEGGGWKRMQQELHLAGRLPYRTSGSVGGATRCYGCTCYDRSIGT